MGIAVFSDIHGNLEAAQAILRRIKRDKRITQVYFLGDAIGFGPDGRACLQLFRDAGVHCVLGNHEQRVVLHDDVKCAIHRVGKKHIAWVSNKLSNADIRFISEMPTEIKINYKGFNLLFAHCAMNESGIIINDHAECTEARLAKFYEDARCDVVFLGHYHQRKLIIYESGKSFLCLGSSGCVKHDITHYTYFDVLDSLGEELHFDVQRVNVKFNRKKFEERFNNEDIPEKEKFANFYFGLSREQ